ncbi:MAG: cardiolipin synthase ClsB [Rhodoferax sp.]|nr:cardiolipin synthase ClsB [Rhodoferax sp.]
MRFDVQLQAGHAVQLLQGGQEFFPALIADIESSQSEVRLETYIFLFDPSGERVAAALEGAAQRGVQVYVLIDGVGTEHIPESWAQRWDDAGVHWKIYSPMGFWGLLHPRNWRRLHRKLCVVDAAVAFCGGINVLDDLRDPVWGPQEFPRFDFSVRLTGPVVQDIRHAMGGLWRRLQVNQQLKRLELRGARGTMRASLPRIAPVDADAPAFAKDAGVKVALVQRDNLRNRTRIERAYLRAIAEARSEIILANAYFLPGARLRRALVQAARRGVKVRLLVQGRYEYFMQFHGSRTAFAMLVSSGVEISEYQPAFLHAKVAVMDGLWATVGSSNLDPLSLLLAREANVVIVDPEFAGALRSRLIEAIDSQSHALGGVALARRTWPQRLYDYLAFAVLRGAVFLTGRRY